MGQYGGMDMKIKKLSALIMIITLMLSGVVLTSANTDIVNTMDFQGEAIELSLKEAITLAKTDSALGKAAEWHLDKARASSRANRSSAGDANDLRDFTNAYYKETGVDISFDMDVPTSKDVELLRLLGEFAKNQMDKNYEAEMNTLKAQVNALYFGVLQAQDLVKINEENLKVQEKLYKDTQTKFELGMVAKQETLTAEHEYIQAQTEYEAAVNIYKKAKMNFNVFMGYDVMQEVILTDTLTDVEMPDIELADAISQAFTKRNEVYGAELQIEIQKINMDKVSVRYSKAAPQYIEKSALYDEAVYNYENVFDAMEMDVRSKYLDMMEKKHAIQAYTKAVESAEEALRLTQLTYDAGMSILTDVQEVQTRVLQSKLGLSKAILEYNLAVDAFEDSMGVGRKVIPIM